MERTKCCLGVLLALLFLGAQPVMAQHAIALDHVSPQVEPWMEYDFTEAGEAEEKARAERRRRQQEQDRRRAKKPPKIQLVAIYGSQELYDEHNPRRTATASTKGMGVRFAHGLSRWVVLEGETSYINSGTARFKDTRRYKIQGEMTRDISLLRVLFGAMVRLFDSNLSPAVHAGTGFQQAFIDTRLVAGGSLQGAADSAKVYDLSWYFGSGLDLRLGRINAGLRVSRVAQAISFGSELLGSDSVAAEFHLGFSWSP